MQDRLEELVMRLKEVLSYHLTLGKGGKSMLKKLMLLVLCLGWISFSFAATTGKIAGVVKDADTGEGLPGANVVIEGTSMGASTDINGNYFIINVPPGTYTLRTTFIGYTTEVVKDVVVRIDRTTTVNVSLKPKVIEAGGEVVVTAQREVVRQDVSFTQTNLDVKTIESVPATFRLDDALTSQVGVSQDNQGLVIRRSNNTEIGYYVDGISLRDDRMDRDMSRVSKTAISEVQLLTGTFGAEYGNARAGIVNVVTKVPRQKYFLNFEGRMSPLWGGDDPDHPGLKHFGPFIYSDKNWWEYGRYEWNDGKPAADKNGDGEPDFMGWNAWAENNTFHGQKLTPYQAYQVWVWQHRSEDDQGNIYYNGKKIGTIESMYQSRTSHHDALNWYSFQPDWNVDMTVGGPVPFTNGKVGFVLSHVRENSMYPFFTPNNSTYRYNTTQAKLLWSLNPNMKLNFSGIYTDLRNFNYGDPRPRSGVGGQTLQGVRSFYRSNSRTYAWDTRMIPRGQWYTFLNLTWTHTLSPKTFYEVKLQNTNIDYNQIPNVRERNIGTVYTVGPVTLDESPKGWSYKKGDKRDILNIFEIRDGREMDLSYTKAFRVAFDITSQINVHHQLKAGFEWVYNDLLEMRGFTQNYLYLVNEKYRLGPDGKPGTDDDGRLGDQANWHNVHVFPWHGGIYAQDRMEYGGMILNLGLRMDLHQPHRTWYDRNDYFMPSDNVFWQKHWKKYGSYAPSPNHYGLPADVHPPLQVRLSPRIGISHPIGPESKIYFNYGHFYDIPSSDWLYRFQLGVDEPLEKLGNPWLRMPKTIQFEAGYEQRIYGDYVATIRGYYKDITGDIDELGIVSRSSGDPSYAINARARDIKGIELQLEKKYGTFLTGFINADFNNEKLSRYGWHHLYAPELSQSITDPTYVSYLRVVSNPYVNAQYPGSWNVKANISLHTPADWGPGPVFAGSKLLGWWQLDVLHQWRQGAPYSWNPDGLQSLQGVYNHRNKDYNWTQMHLEKRFQFGGVTAGAFLEITNLFNVKNLYSANFSSLTSRQDRSEAKNYERAYMEAIFKEGKKRGDEVSDPKLMPQRYYIFWGAPRDYWLGLRLYF